jgi:hypothetical protein
MFENDENDDILDTSWIDEFEKTNNIENNFIREPLKNIHFYFVYINKNKNVDKIIIKNHSLENSCISKEKLLYIIENNRTFNNYKYKLLDLLLHSVDLEPHDIQNFINSSKPKYFLKPIPIFNDIIIPSSILMFHPLNSLFFLFIEHDLPPKSILKKNHKTKKMINVIDHINHTKKCRFSPDV